MYRVLRALWVRPGAVLALDYLDEDEAETLIERGIIEPVEQTEAADRPNENEEDTDGD